MPLHPFLEEAYATGSYLDQKGETVNPFPIAIPKATAKILHDLVASRDCRRTLEVGLAHGFSAVAICQAHAERGEGAHVAIDPFQHSPEHWCSRGIQNLERTGLREYVRFLPETSFRALPRLWDEGLRLDMAFIDGRHFFEYAMVEFVYTDLMLETGGVIVVDDLWLPAVRQFLSFVVSNRRYRRISVTADIPLWRKAAMMSRRVFQTPFARDHAGSRFVGSNIYVMEKLGEDNRPLRFHRYFS